MVRGGGKCGTECRAVWFGMEDGVVRDGGRCGTGWRAMWYGMEGGVVWDGGRCGTGCSCRREVARMRVKREGFNMTRMRVRVSTSDGVWTSLTLAIGASIMLGCPSQH